MHHYDNSKSKCEPLLSFCNRITLGVIKMSMLTYTYPHKPLGRLKWPYIQSPGWQPTLCVAWCLIWWFANLGKHGHTWHRMSLLKLSVIKQHKHKHFNRIILIYKIIFMSHNFNNIRKTISLSLSQYRGELRLQYTCHAHFWQLPASVHYGLILLDLRVHQSINWVFNRVKYYMLIYILIHV